MRTATFLTYLGMPWRLVVIIAVALYYVCYFHWVFEPEGLVDFDGNKVPS